MEVKTQPVENDFLSHLPPPSSSFDTSGCRMFNTDARTIKTQVCRDRVRPDPNALPALTGEGNPPMRNYRNI